jgi:hypothetical protein
MIGMNYIYHNLPQLLQLIIGFISGFAMYLSSTILFKIEAFKDFKNIATDMLLKKQKIKIKTEQVS